MASRNTKTVFVGVDVSKDTLAVAWKGLKGAVTEFTVVNDSDGWGELLERVTSGRIQVARLVVEATGPYSAGIVASTASHTKAQVMRLRPADAKAFARLTARAKTDRVDARVLCSYAETMPFRATALPSEEALRVRKMSRHLSKVVARRAASRTEQKSARVEGLEDPISWAFEAEQEALGRIIDELEQRILTALEAIPQAAACTENWRGIKGVKNGVICQVLPEFISFPIGLTPKQVVAMIGLDPRPKQSGQRGAKASWPISKMGHSRIRRILWCAANTAVRHQPAIRVFYESLLARGKEKKVALIAVMRKLLVVLWRMYQTGERFNGRGFTSRFQPATT